VKLAAWPGFRLPDLAGVAGFAEVQPEVQRQLDAVYYDAPDLRLIRAGATVRHRSGDGEPTWTVKVPGKVAAGMLARTEVNEPGPPDAVPDSVRSLVQGMVRRAPLVPVAHLHTVRTAVVLRDGGGRALAEVSDDEVSVLEEDRVAARFREVEVELAPGAPDVLIGPLLERLRMAGAGDADPTPKLVRALGPRALAPPDPPVLGHGAVPTVADVVQAAIAGSVQRLLLHDPLVRLDAGPVGVHQARVSTRRLRSDLRTFRELLAPGFGEGLRDSLSGLARELGAVRDADVLLMRLDRQATKLDRADANAARRLLTRLRRQRQDALRHLLEVLEGEPYLELLDRLVDAANHPAVLRQAAVLPARDALAKVASGPWRKLVKRAEELGDGATDAQLHELRIAVKRVRYAADAAALAIGDAAPHADALAELQGVLGEQHDAVVAEQWLRSTVTAGTSRNQALAAGLLVAQQRREAAEHREQWQEAWADASKKKVRAWLDR
jgi:CHAD domain-containing protein